MESYRNMKEKDLYIVAIGASAGGAEPITEFFSYMPEDPGMAFVILRHLKRDYRTEFDAILRRYTSMRTVTVRNPEKVEANTIYLMPESHKLIIRNGMLHPVERPESEIINNSINDFFISLAEAAGDKAIAIVLSGYMSDGARGAKAIEDKGGLVMVQDPKSALVDAMPLQTILNDHPDYVLPPYQMPKALMNYVHKQRQYH